MVRYDFVLIAEDLVCCDAELVAADCMKIVDCMLLLLHE